MTPRNNALRAIFVMMLWLLSINCEREKLALIVALSGKTITPAGFVIQDLSNHAKNRLESS